jgi:predicted ribosome quality control (RQC) complex YloA/Tae2 family protein
VEYHPILFQQYRTTGQYLSFPSFNSAVDRYYSLIETQRIQMKVANQEDLAKKKLNMVESELNDRISALEVAQQEDVKMARLIECNIQKVWRNKLKNVIWIVGNRGCI